MPTAQVAGLASGIDWQETIELIMQIESQPMIMLEDRKDVYENKLEAWQSINSKLLSLKSAMEAMDQLNELLAKAAASTDTNVVTASATAEAISGSYTVEVNQLAQSHKLTHEGFVDENTTAVYDGTGSNTFEYTYQGETHTITLAAGTTLAGLAAAINNDVDNPGVTATILNDGGDTNAYHLVLTGETGADNIVSVTATPQNLTNVFSTTQNAQDAQIRVDGYPPDPDWITSSTNEISDVISGVTLNLKSADPGNPVTISVSDDTDAVKDKIQEFVDAYNEVIGLINLKTQYVEGSEEGNEEEGGGGITGPLFGDASAIGIKSDLQSIIVSVVPGLQDNALYRSLSEVGLKTGSGGLLSIDDAKLTDALETDFTGVGELFAFSSTSTSNNLSYFTRTEDTQGGVYSVVANYNASGQLISATINGSQAQIDGDYIIGMAGNPEEGLRILFTDPGGGAGSVSAEIRLATGSAVQIANRSAFLTDPIDGTVHYAEEGIEDVIDSLDRQIARWEDRLESTQQQLEQEFLAMEVLIGQLQGQGNYLSAMMSSL